MRKNYISSDFTYTKVPGTMGMLEYKNMFGSKMLCIDDVINIDDLIISYSQNLNNEQLDLNQEISVNTVTYNPSDDKLRNHTLSIDSSQQPFEKDKQTKWVIDINLTNLLFNNLFAKLKYYRSFEGITNDITSKKSVDSSIIDYIQNNITNRYKFKSFDLYLKYFNLTDNNLLRYSTTWDNLIYLPENKETRTEQNFIGDDRLIVKFRQSKDSNVETFSYYFNLTWERI
jgi:hypothetical protein